jgi:hypothetical protein
MKNQTIVQKLSWLLALSFASALVFSACKNTSEHPQGEHPQEHPATNTPPRNP